MSAESPEQFRLSFAERMAIQVELSKALDKHGDSGGDWFKENHDEINHLIDNPEFAEALLSNREQTINQLVEHFKQKEEQKPRGTSANLPQAA